MTKITCFLHLSKYFQEGTILKILFYHNRHNERTTDTKTKCYYSGICVFQENPLCPLCFIF